MMAVWASKMLIPVYETAWSDILPSQNSMHINCFPVSIVMLLPNLFIIPPSLGAIPRF
jgi:hypothetical protein